MKLFLLLLGLIALLGGGGYWYLRAHPEAAPVLPIEWQLAQFDQLKQRVADVAQQARTRIFPEPGATQVDTVTATSTTASSVTPSSGAGVAPTAVVAQAVSPTPDASASTASVPPLLQLQRGATLYLTNGGVVTGELVRETPQEVTLRWEYGEVGFQRAEITRIVKDVASIDGDGITMPWEGQQEQWPYQHDVVVKLKKGTVVDAKLTTVTPEALILTQVLSVGGTIEHTIQRDDIEELLFRPIQNERSKQIEQTLQTIFPAMSWSTEGMFTIVTDSSPPTVKAYRRTVRELAAEWYLTFFPLVKDRAPSVQCYLVIFENWDAYFEYALTDGVPGWLAVGYFSPDDQILYCFNMLGERFAEYIYDAYLGQFRKVRDEVEGQFTGSRYADAVSGQLSTFLKKLETAHAIARQFYTQIGTDILRHELTHALFHSWRLQTIVMSQMGEADQEKAQKKREFLETDDPQKKRQLLEELFASAGKTELTDVRATNAWFIEGLAGYMEPTPIGAINSGRLSEFQEARRNQQILPLEFLNAFRLGSFVGMSTQSQLYAYAQSWAFCHFLMQRYPTGFLAYLDRLAAEPPQEGEDTVSWLAEAVGQDQRVLKQEFLASMDQFPPEDSLRIKQMKELVDLIAELRALAHQLWG